MKTTIREYDITKINKYKTWKEVEHINVQFPSLLAIDASTSNTGVSIISNDGSLLYTIGIKRESEETPVEYKLKYKAFMKEVLTKQIKIERVFYEEHFVGYAEAAKRLYMLSSTVPEILIEEKLNIPYKEISNKKWKKYLFEMCGYTKHVSDTEEEKGAIKDAIKKCLVAQIPCLGMGCVTQDELDSLGLGMVALVYGGKVELESKKKPTKFNYEAKFFGGDEEDDSDFFMQYGDGTGIIPKALLNKDIIFKELNGREKFDNAVYRELCDIDETLILKFDGKKYGDIRLRYKLGEMESKYIYAVIWRKSRKK